MYKEPIFATLTLTLPAFHNPDVAQGRSQLSVSRLGTSLDGAREGQRGKGVGNIANV